MDTSRTIQARVAIASAFLAVAASGAGCATETRIVRMRGIGHDFAGAQAGWMKDADAASSRGAKANAPKTETKDLKAVEGPAQEQGAPLRETLDDGTIRLISRTPRELVYHLRQTLIAGETDLLFDQVLSERTKQEYWARDLDPRDAVVFLEQNKRDVLRLLARMPLGEMTPGLFLKKVGESTYRLEIFDGARGMKFRKVDFVWERSGVRLALIS